MPIGVLCARLVDLIDEMVCRLDRNQMQVVKCIAMRTCLLVVISCFCKMFYKITICSLSIILQ